MAIMLNVSLALAVIFLVKFVIRKWRHYSLMRKLPSPKGRLIFGNAYHLFGARDETAMGKRIDTQLGKNNDYFNALTTVANMIMFRSIHPWLLNHWIFELSSYGRAQKRCLKIPFYGRRLNNDIDMGGYLIPSGAEVFVSPARIGTDPNVYPNPRGFDPSRFLNEDFQKKHPYAYVPFSAGPRNCIGQKFAMMEEKVVLANVLRNFEIKTYDNMKSAKAVADLVFRPINGMRISLEKKVGNERSHRHY